jgi:hypothetical protein
MSTTTPTIMIVLSQANKNAKNIKYHSHKNISIVVLVIVLTMSLERSTLLSSLSFEPSSQIDVTIWLYPLKEVPFSNC